MNRLDYIRSGIHGIFSPHTFFAIVAALLLIYSQPVYSAPVIVDENLSSINVSSSIEYLEDREGTLGIDQVKKITGADAWKANNKDYLNFGYTPSVYWFKFTLSNTRNFPDRLLLEIDFPSLDYVDCHYPDGRGGYGAYRTGDRLPFSSRPVRDRSFIFPLNPVPGDGTYYLRVANQGSLRFHAILLSERTLIESRGLDLPLIGLVYGMILLTAIFYFFLFVFMRDRVYLYFSIYAMVLFFHQISLRGFAFQFLWPSWPAWANALVPLLMNGFGLFSAMFLIWILDTRATSAIWHRLFSFFGFIAFPAIMALSLLLPLRGILLATYYTLLVYNVALIIPATVYYVKRGNRFARYFLAGVVILVTTNIITSLTALGKLPATPFTEWSNEMGYLLLILFSSLGLVDRFRVMNNDLKDSQLSIKENNEMLTRANEEMTAANEELEAMNEEFEAQNRELMNSSRALMASEMELKDIFNSSHDTFIIHDLEGRILDVNDKMLAMYGLSREEALAMNIADISSSDTDMALGDQYWKRVIGGGELLFEWKARRPGDNRTFVVEVGLKKLTWRGREVILASVRDLTERKIAETERENVRNQLVQAQKMEAVGTLAGGIAHDFNNVLGGIMGSLNLMSLLLRKEQLENAEKIFNYLEMALESSKRAADITKQILTLSRKGDLQMSPVIIQNSLKNVMNICKNSFPKSVELDFRYDDDPLHIYADPTQIEQALLNLCVNASHAMTMMRGWGDRQGGKLTVDARLMLCNQVFCVLHPGAIVGAPYVMIRVEDTGVGMDYEVQRRIFEPFFTTKSQNEGTGLGLAITYGIVKQHDGFLNVESEPGKGSVFTMYLPLMEEAPAGATDGTGSIIMGTGRILVIDDEETILRVTVGILEQCGYEVIAAGKADQGMLLFEREHGNINAVVLDNSMPGMSGMEMYRAMKKIDPDVRVLLCSGYIDSATIKKARGMGIREFIDKPYSLEELSRKINDVLK